MPTSQWIEDLLISEPDLDGLDRSNGNGFDEDGCYELFRRPIDADVNWTAPHSAFPRGT